MFATAISVCLAAGNFNTTQVNIKILNMNVWGVKFFSKERRARMRGTAEFLRASDYDLVFIQELWYQEDFQLLAATFPYSTRQGTPGSYLCPPAADYWAFQLAPLDCNGLTILRCAICRCGTCVHTTLLHCAPDPLIIFDNPNN